VADDPKRRIGGHERFAGARSAVPVEIDPEDTPPPREPPGPEAFEAMPPSAQVRALRAVVAEQAAAIERVWDARHVAAELELLKAEQQRLGVIVAADTRQVTGLIVEVQQLRDIAKDAFDKSIALSEKHVGLDAQLGVFFNKQFPEYLEEVKSSNALLRSVQQRVDDVEHRVDNVEAKQAEHSLAIANLDKVVDGLVLAARDEQVASTAVVKERARWWQVFKLGHAAAVAIGGGIAWFIHWLKS
jgi:hypothetical protein